MFNKLVITDTGEVDYGIYYMHDRWNKRIIPLSIIVSLTALVGISVYAYNTGNLNSESAIWNAVLCMMLGTVGALMTYFVINAIKDFAIILYLEGKRHDTTFSEKVKYYFFDNANKPLCYLQEVKILDCGRGTTIKAYSYKPFEVGTKVYVTEHSTTTVTGEVITNKAIFNRAYFDHLELMESDTIK